MAKNNTLTTHFDLIFLIAVKLKIKSIKITYIPRSGNSLNPTVNPTNSAKIKRLEKLNVPQVSIFVSICGMPRSGVDSADEFMWSCSKNKKQKQTRMHSSRMRTARSLTVSHRKNHACPPPSNHTHPPEQPHMPPRSNHAHPPRATTHAPPGATTHAPLEQPHMPPRATTHAPQSNHACPPCGQTDTCKNITFANFICGW